MANVKTYLTDRIVDFILEHRAENRNTLRQIVNKHIEYGTISILTDDLGIYACMRFNVDGECIHITDLIIRSDKENGKVIKWITADTWPRFPFLKFFKFNRNFKYPTRPTRAYSISKLLKGQSNGR